MGSILYRLGFSNGAEFVSTVEGMMQQADQKATTGGAKAGKTFGEQLRAMFQGERRGFDDSVSSVMQSAEQRASDGGRAAGKGFTDNFKALVSGAALGSFVGTVVGQAFSQATRAVQGFVSDIQQRAPIVEGQMSRINAVFTQSQDIVQEWADRTAASYGMTTREAMSAAAGTTTLLTQMGVAQREAAGLSTQVVDLSAAFAEYTKGEVSAEQATDLLSRAMLGQTRGLVQLGIQLDAAQVKQRLVEKGQDGLTGQARKTAEAVATLELVTERSTDAQRVFAESSEDLGRKQAKARARIEEAKDELAIGLIPVMEHFYTNILPPLISWLDTTVRGFVNLQRATEGAAGAQRRFAQSYGQTYNLTLTPEQQRRVNTLVPKIADLDREIVQLEGALEAEGSWQARVAQLFGVNLTGKDEVLAMLEQRREEAGKLRLELFEINRIAATTKPEPPPGGGDDDDPSGYQPPPSGGGGGGGRITTTAPVETPEQAAARWERTLNERLRIARNAFEREMNATTYQAAGTAFGTLIDWLERQQAALEEGSDAWNAYQLKIDAARVELTRFREADTAAAREQVRQQSIRDRRAQQQAKDEPYADMGGGLSQKERSRLLAQARARTKAREEAEEKAALETYQRQQARRVVRQQSMEQGPYPKASLTPKEIRDYLLAAKERQEKILEAEEAGRQAAIARAAQRQKRLGEDRVELRT